MNESITKKLAVGMTEIAKTVQWVGKIELTRANVTIVDVCLIMTSMFLLGNVCYQSGLKE